MTSQVPLQRTDEDIETARTLVHAGVLGPTHRRWPEMRAVARALGCRPEDVVYRIHDGIWSDHADTTAPTTS